MDGNEDPGVVEMLDADVEEISRRQVGPVGSQPVGLQPQDAVHE